MVSGAEFSGCLPSRVKKIGIVRANALGDFIVTLPAICSLRAAYPQAEIVLFGKPWHKAFLEESEQGLRRTPVDRVVVLPVMKGLREEPGQQEDTEMIRAFFREMEDEDFDILLSFQGKGLAAIPFIRRIGAPFTAGLTCGESEKPHAFFDFYHYQSEVVRYLEIAMLAGAQPVSIEPSLNLLEKDLREADGFLKQAAPEKFIALHACGTDIRRMWTTEKFASLCRALHEKEFSLVLTGSREDNAYNQEIIDCAEVPVVNASGKLSLGGVTALYRRAEAVVSVDTGPLHLAIAAGAKTVGLYWAPNFINWAPVTRRNHRPVVNWRMTCPECGIMPNDPFPFEPVSQSCMHLSSFIEDITVEQVAANVFSLINTSITSC